MDTVLFHLFIFRFKASRKGRSYVIPISLLFLFHSMNLPLRKILQFWYKCIIVLQNIIERSPYTKYTVKAYK